jgi:hypothetical protein
MAGIIYADKDYKGGAIPRLKDENPDVFPASPLALVGLWIHLVRARFAYDEDSELPWAWFPNAQQDTNTENPRAVMVESAYNYEKSDRNYRPAIYIGRFGNNVSPTKTVLDNKAGHRFTDRFEVYYCQCVCPIIFVCEAESMGESAILAETLWGFILSCRDIIREHFGLHEVTEPVLSDTQAQDTDKKIWSTSVQLQVTFDSRWTTVPQAPKIRDIAVKIHKEDPAGFYTNLVLHKDFLEK